MLNMPQSIIDELVSKAREEAPREACGYLAGVTEKELRVIKKFLPMRNMDESNVHFTFDPKEQFAALKEAQNAGLRLLACWHSHPETPARPSEEDIRLAYDPNISYIILSLASEPPTLKSFKIKKGTAEEEEIKTI